MTIAQWVAVFFDYKKRLGMPCFLSFNEDIAVANHRFDDEGTCMITINPTVDFRRPEHLILHEFAHHRICAAHVNSDAYLDPNIECHFGWGDGHCEHWAQTLCDMYRETDTDLPFTTSFAFFAKAAGIRRQNFVTEGNDG